MLNRKFRAYKSKLLEAENRQTVKKLPFSHNFTNKADF
jgi:hypothetical protein